MTVSISAVRKYKIEILSIVLAILFSHGLLLLNDGYYWEDAKIMRWIRTNSWDDLYGFYHMGGHEYLVNIYRFIHWFSDSLFLYKLIIFLCLLSTTFLVFIIAIRSQFLTRLESLWV